MYQYTSVSADISAIILMISLVNTRGGVAVLEVFGLRIIGYLKKMRLQD
jgi:hypothetical protein